MTDWQPIETAPQDGREILVVTGDIIRVGRQKMFAKDTWEYFRDDKWAPGHTWSIVPTHWMPLPLPPAERPE